MKTIVLIEDSRLVRTLIEKDLTRSGYQVISAADGEEGLRTAREQHPDLILLDMLLPKLTGLEVLHALKSDQHTKDMPVIVLTGLSKENAGRLLGSGADAFFEKSDQNLKGGSGNLIRIIEEVIEKHLAGPTAIVTAR